MSVNVPDPTPERGFRVVYWETSVLIDRHDRLLPVLQGLPGENRSPDPTRPVVTLGHLRWF